MNITDMTPAQLGEVVKAETTEVMAKGVGIYPGMEVRHVKSGHDYQRCGDGGPSRHDADG